MANAKGVVLAFATFREAGDAVVFPVRVEIIASTGEDFMSVGLMSHIPDQKIVGRIVGVMQRGGEFDDAE